MTDRNSPVSLDDLGMTRFLKKVTIFSSGGPFLEGYVLAIVGVALPQMSESMHINATWSGLIGVAAIIGLTLGTTIGGWMTDKLGRKKMFIFDVSLIAFLSVICVFLSTPFQLFCARLLIGVAIGADYPIATSMIAEFTPRRYRAISMGFIAAVWYLGANTAYLVGYFMTGIDGAWKWMLASSVIPCLVILIGRWSVPESPRWLMSKGRINEANQILQKVFAKNVVLEDEKVEETDYLALFKGTYLRRIIFVGLIWLCQAVPMFAIYTFGPLIMSKFGLGVGSTALIGEVIIGTFFLIGTIPAMFLAEYWGRRPLIITCFAVMTVSLIPLGIYASTSVFLVICCFAIYALFSGGPGNLEWLYPNELFPTNIRASAMGVAMAISRIGTVISIYILPSFIEEFGTATTMLVGAVISAFGLIICLFLAPETKNLPLSVTSDPNFRGLKNV